MTTATSTGLVPAWTVGDRLRKARETTSLDAETFADEIGVHRDTVSNYEKGRTKRHSRAVLNQWVMRTGVSLVWIKTGETPAGPEGPDGGQEVRHQGLEPRTRCVTPGRPVATLRELIAA